MIDTERGDGGFATSQLGGISSAAAGKADTSVMAKLKVEGLRPGFALFAESVSTMLVGIESIQSAAS